jgi:dTDP-4-amino-4,6-dideoxygalactose transaminase
LLHPHWYAFVNRAPFLHLGETRYHPLQTIKAAPETVHKLLAENYKAYQQRSLKPESFYHQQLHTKQKLQSLDSERKQRLLRYPLLLESASDCSELYRQLSADGLGGARLYQDSLSAIQGVDGKIRCFSNLAHAKSFASRLITLPVHAYVQESHLQKIISRVNSI